MGGEYSFFSHKQKLYCAIESGNLKQVSLILQDKPNLIQESLSKDNKHTPLTRAIFRRDEEMARMILGMGADPNNQVNGLTPLMYATKRDSIRIVQLLLSYQADHKIKTSQQLDCLDYSILYGNYSVAKFLIDHIEMKPNLSSAEYERISQSKRIFYVNYHTLLLYLKPGYVPDILPNFFEPLQQMQKQLISMSKQQQNMSVRPSFNLSNKRLRTSQCVESTQRRLTQQIKASLLEESNY